MVAREDMKFIHENKLHIFKPIMNFSFEIAVLFAWISANSTIN